jgi:hypothetical protein
MFFLHEALFMLIWVTSSLLQLNVGTTPKKISLDANPV